MLRLSKYTFVSFFEDLKKVDMEKDGRRKKEKRRNRGEGGEQEEREKEKEEEGELKGTK